MNSVHVLMAICMKLASNLPFPWSPLDMLTACMWPSTRVTQFDALTLTKTHARDSLDSLENMARMTVRRCNSRRLLVMESWRHED